MPLGKLKAFLDKNDIRYVIIQHSLAYTASEIAALAHVPGKNLAKTVIIKIGKKLAMAVLPASFRIDLQDLKNGLNEENVEIASESDFKDLFTDCELGAMPPFGNLYDMEVYVSDSLAEDNEITFNACSHRELIRLAFKDFQKLVKPKIIEFSYHN